jgi:16S rRNA (guanine527-N7)-methyltransferase
MGVPLGSSEAGALVALLDRIALEPQNLTAVSDPADGVDRHLADSLSGLVLPAVRDATAAVDVGSGAGFPGLALAIARPGLPVTLVESEGRKADWLRRTSAGCHNVRVVADRSEHLASDEGAAWPLVTARALGPLPVTLELAAPLVAMGGTVVVWRADPAPEEERGGATAASKLGLRPTGVTAVRPFREARRHLHEFRKVAPTPERFPRRPGRAASRPLA